MTRKLRTTIATVLAASAVAVAAVPTAFSAPIAPSPGDAPAGVAPVVADILRSKDGDKLTKAEHCKGLRDVGNAASENAHQAFQKGNKRLGKAFQAIADDAYEQAAKLGCKWAIG